MLISEAQGWYYFISWDNPDPPDSRTMLKALKKLGKVTILLTKTSVVLAPGRDTTWRDVRKVIKENLSRRKGNAFYVNLRSGKGFHIGLKTKHAWKEVTK